MKRVLLGGLAAGLMMLTVPAANATAGYTIHGGCYFDTNSQATATNGQFVGVIGDRSVTTTDATPPALVSGSVGCKIVVNGNDAVGPFYYGDSGHTGVQVGQNAPISFAAADGDSVQLCQQVAYDGGSYDAWDCAESMSFQIPPDEVINALNTVFDLLTALQVTYTDPLICSVLPALAGSYGPVTITSQGDVLGPDPLDLGLNPYFDCPPYEL